MAFVPGYEAGELATTESLFHLVVQEEEEQEIMNFVPGHELGQTDY